MPSKNVAWIEGQVKAQDIINTLATAITTAVLPATVTNKWTVALKANADKWVTYKEQFRNGTAGMYLHTDGKTYPVFKANDMRATSTPTGGTALMDVDGFVWENIIGITSSTRTGKKFQARDFQYTDALSVVQTLAVPGLLLVNVDDAVSTTGKKCYVVQQIRKELDNSYVANPNWNEFKILTEMPSDWDYFLKTGAVTFAKENGYTTTLSNSAYTFQEKYYTADLINYTDNVAVLKSTPDVTNAQTPKDFFVMLKQPASQYNYIEVYHGEGFTGTASVGLSSQTYTLACDVSTVVIGSIPIIIDQKQANAAYVRQSAVNGVFKPPVLTWGLDYDGVTRLLSPASYFFYGANSVVPWLPNKKRRPDYLVSYALSINNNRVAVMLEGDPSPDTDGYYRSFGYFGSIVPFNIGDYEGNFAVTVGTGDLTVAKTGFVPSQINHDTNTAYALFGRNTSNGMTSVSMMKTASGVLFQAYYPALLTQQPGYTGGGTIPSVLSNLVLESFQASVWTKKYHASPIYIVHQFEGYRGYMDGIVAITNINLVNRDELVVDTEEWKDPLNHSLGTWTEVYKYYAIKSPTNFLNFSANPNDCSIGILKEVR